MPNAQRVVCLKAHIEDKPGSLLAVLKELKAKNLGLIALWASAGEVGWTNLYVIPKNPEKVRNLWKESSLLVEERTAFFLKGTDKTGVLVKTLDAIAQTGINLIRTEALAVGGKYGAFFLVAPADVDKMAKAVGAK